MNTTVKELRAERERVIASARRNLDDMEACNDEKKLLELQKLHDANMAAFDKIDEQLKRYERVEEQERMNANYRAGLDDGVNAARSASLRPIPDDVTYGGVDGEAWVTRSGWSDTKKNNAEVRVLTPRESFATERYDGPSLGECLRALILGPRNDAERRALSEGTDSAGGFTVPTPLAAIYIDKLRAASVVMRAGATTIDMTSETLAIARLATDPTMTWRLENAEVSASDPTFERVLLEAKSMAGLVKVSRELLEDSVNIAAILENAFVQAAAVEFDRACLYGDPDDDEPTGVVETSGITVITNLSPDGGSLDTNKLVDAVFAGPENNAPAPTAMIYHPRTGKTIAKIKDGQGLPLIYPTEVANVPKMMTTSIPITETLGANSDCSSIITGYFPHMLVGIRTGLRIDVLKERYGEFMQYGFLAHMRGDMQLAQKKSFAHIRGIR